MKTIYLVSLLVLSTCTFSQKGFIASVGFNIYLDYKAGLSTHLNGTVGYHIQTKINSNVNYYELTPSVSLVFSKGAIGSQTFLDRKKGQKRKESNTMIFASILTGFKNVSNKGSKNIFFENTPVYHFSNYLTPLRYDSSQISINLGTNLIYDFKHKTLQRVGTLSAQSYGFSIAYSNDGMPFQLLHLGDNEDRLFTGALVLSYSNDYLNSSHTMLPNRLELSYHKYTGFEKNNYEHGTATYVNELFYEDSTKAYFNLGEWQINAQGNLTNFSTYKIGGYNRDKYRSDFQHYIHYHGYMSHHISPNSARRGVILSGIINTSQK